MAEATGLPGNGEELQAAFARIEAAVDAGESNLSKLGFWRALRAVKLDPALSEHWADQAGRIDRKAFENGVKLRFPVWFGNLVLLTGTLFGGRGGGGGHANVERDACGAGAPRGRRGVVGLASTASRTGWSG